jgi:hypothetical protein
MAWRSFYSTRRQCRRRQGVVVGDAEDVPSSIIEVELWAGRGTSSSGFSTFVPVSRYTQPTTTPSLVPSPWTSRDRDERVTWRVSLPSTISG